MGLTSLKLAKTRGTEVAWMDARLTYQVEIPCNSDQVQSNSFRKEPTPLLEPLETKEIPVHDTLIINRMKLSDFKQVLCRNGITAEFIDGDLWCCNRTLSLRRVKRIFFLLPVVFF